MKINKIILNSSSKIFKLGKISFNLGTLFLASALPLAVIFYIFSISASIYINNFSFYKNKWNLTLLIASLLMLLSSINSYFTDYSQLVNLERSEIWLNLFNWLPLFLLFSTTRVFLKSNNDRIEFSKYLLIGTVPVVITCLIQKWFNIYGPFETFQGLIVWYNKEIDGNGVSGLFSNQNYTGFWLSTIFPISLGIFLYKKRIYIKNFLIITFIISIFYTTLLTTSRNAIIGLFTSLSIILGVNLLLKLFILLVFLSFLVYFLNIFFPVLILNFSEFFLPINILDKFQKLDLDYKNWQRFMLWNEAAKYILLRPYLGYGAASFGLFFITKYKFGYNITHIHNMPLQLAFDYGIPLSMVLSGFVIILLMKSWRNIMGRIGKNNSEGILNKCWLTSTIVTVLSHINDINYYDGKISILIWLLFSGLICINNEAVVARRNNIMPLKLQDK